MYIANIYNIIGMAAETPRMIVVQRRSRR